MADKRLDFLLFGATGVTGVHTIPLLQKFSKKNKLTWGVSGRSESKLKTILKNTGVQIGEDLSTIPVVLADIGNQKSLDEMAQKAKVILNCCGPYKLMGFQVIDACIKAGTHHVDVSGEPGFIDALPEKYDAAAKEQGIYIVSACGLDCLPTDLGSTYLQQQFDGVLNSIVSYVEVWTTGKKLGSYGGYGTWQSLINECYQMGSISELKKKFFPPVNEAFKPLLPVNHLPQFSEISNGWLLPFLGHDRNIMYETQKYLYNKESQRPVHNDVKSSVGSIFTLILLKFALILLLIAAQFSFTRNLLLKYPLIFSGGYVSKEEHPSEEAKNHSHYRVTFYGEGWKEKLANPDDQYATSPNKSIVAKLEFSNWYNFTSLGLIGAGVVILNEQDKLPKGGGVYTPGAAFRKTSLMKILLENGTTFEIKSVKDI